jgi:hypothetical protein
LLRNYSHKVRTLDLGKPNVDFTLLDCRVEVPGGLGTIPGVPRNLPLDTPGFARLIYSTTGLLHELLLLLSETSVEATASQRHPTWPTWPGKYIQTLAEKRQSDDRNMASVVGRSIPKKPRPDCFIRFSRGIRVADTLY